MKEAQHVKAIIYIRKAQLISVITEGITNRVCRILVNF